MYDFHTGDEVIFLPGSLGLPRGDEMNDPEETEIPLSRSSARELQEQIGY